VNAQSNESSPLYAFSAAHPNWKKKLQQDVPLPRILSFTHPRFTKINEADGTLEVQFYLGPKGSGAPVHYHGHAVNTLAYGEKVNVTKLNFHPKIIFFVKHSEMVHVSSFQVILQHANGT